MVSFYLASRSVVEEPLCQLSTTVGRPLLEKKTRLYETELLTLLRTQSEVCSVSLPGIRLGCKTREEENQDALVKALEDRAFATFPRNSSKKMHEAEEALWKAGHCHLSTWQAVPINKTTEKEGNYCGYELCVNTSPQEGPTHAFNEIVHSAMIEKIQTNEVAEASVRMVLSKLTKKVWTKVSARAIPWDAFTNFLPEHMGDSRSGRVAVSTWRFWGYDFVLGLIFLISSVLPLAAWVAERRNLKARRQKALIWAHYGIDVVLVEVAAICMLTWRVLGLFGSKLSVRMDEMLETVAGALTKLRVTPEPNISEALSKLGGQLQTLVNEQWQGKVNLQVIELMTSVAEEFQVGLATFLPFLGAAVLFCVASTVFVPKCQLTEEQPWLTRWKVAVGGPLFLLGAARSREVQSLCDGVRQQIIFRGLLLSILLAVFLAPVDDFDAGLVTSLVLKHRFTRVPFVLAWFTLWGLHIVTGMLAVHEIQLRQTLSDETRLVRDIDRQLYGSLNQPARAEEGRGAEAAHRLPAGQSAGVDRVPGTPMAGQSPGPLKSPTLGEV